MPFLKCKIDLVITLTVFGKSLLKMNQKCYQNVVWGKNIDTIFNSYQNNLGIEK